MARCCRTICLVFSYLWKMNNRRQVIDGERFSRQDIQQRVDAAMAHKKVSMADMRALFDINISDSALIKECKAPPTYETMQAIAERLGVPWIGS